MTNTKHTPGGTTSLLTRPNTQPAKGHWATYQAHTIKAHHGDYTGAPRSTARLYLPFDSLAQRKEWIQSFKNPRHQAIAAAAASVKDQTDYGYIDFMLLGLSISRSERQQIQVAQNDNFVEYFFGSSPSGIQLQGVLYDTLQDDWNNNWFEAYWHVWRGTLLARRRQLLRLRVYDRVYSMTVASASESLSANNPMGWSFSLTGTLYSVTRLPDPVVQHTNPTDLPGLLTAGVVRQGSATVESARSRAAAWADLYGSLIRVADPAREFSVGTILPDTSAVPAATPRAGGILPPPAPTTPDAASEAQSAEGTTSLDARLTQIAPKAKPPTKASKSKTAPKGRSTTRQRARDPVAMGPE
jgi:hypothetical protein